MFTKKVLATLLILLMFIGLAYFYRLEITAFISKATEYASLQLRIATLNYVSLELEINQKSYCPWETVKMRNRLENGLYYNVTGNLSTNITGPGAELIFSENWLNIDLPVDEVKYFNTQSNIYEDNSTGTYYVTSVFYYPNNSSFDMSVFRFKKGIGYLVASPPSVEKIVAKGHSDTELIIVWLSYACNNTTAIITKPSDVIGDWLSFSHESIFLTTYDYNGTILNISAPRDVDEGDYMTNFTIQADGQSINIPVFIYVRPADFEIYINITNENEEVCLGDNVSATVDIKKNKPPGVYDINMTYSVLDSDYLLVNTTNEIISINTTVQRNVSLPIPDDAKLGNHTFVARLEFDDVWEQSTELFIVKDCKVPPPPPPPGPPGPGPAAAPAAGPVPLFYQMNLELSTNILSTVAGEKTSFIALVNNTGTLDLESVKLSIRGIPFDWIKILPKAADIQAGRTYEYLVMISVPSSAATGVYTLEVKAVNNMESNTEVLKLFVGKNLEELGKTMIQEIENLRTLANTSLLTRDCLDLSTSLSLFYEAERSYEKGLQNFKSKNYEKAIDWFEHVINSYEKVIFQVNIEMDVKLNSLKHSKLLLIPMFGVKNQIKITENYIASRNYPIICESITRIKKLMLLGLLFWIGLLLLIIVLIIIIIILYKKKKERDREEILKRVRERLGEFKVEEEKPLDTNIP